MISVCVPLIESRRTLFETVTRPAIEVAGETFVARTMLHRTEILVDDDPVLPAGAKRHRLAMQACGEYLLFCDDKVLLFPNALRAMALALEWAWETRAGVGMARVGYVYSDFLMVAHPQMGTRVYESHAFNADDLRRENYIPSIAMVHAEAYKASGGWDQKLTRFQDWDLWLSMLKAGFVGEYIPDQVLSAAFYQPDSISADREPSREFALELVRQKHGLVN